MENVSVLLAFGAGVLSFLSPCVLPLVPAYVAHLTGAAAREDQPRRRTALFHSLLFVLGFSVVFVALGAAIGLAGQAVTGIQPWLTRAAGVVLIVMGVHTAGLLTIPFLYREKAVHFSPKRVGWHQSFLIGSSFSLGWTPCIGPILGGILTLAWSSATVWTGAYLLAAYCLGLGLPFLAAGAALGSVSRWLQPVRRHARLVSLAGGVLLVFMGVLVLTGRLVWLNQFFNFFNLGGGV